MGSNVQSAYMPIRRPNPTIKIRTDASGSGWGATDLHNSTRGRWNENELKYAQNNKINYLELLAIKLGLQSLCKGANNDHILIRMDNTTAVSYLNNMGNMKSVECNNVTRDTWMWCINHKIWATATHLPGKLNQEADSLSRTFNDRTKWMLDGHLPFYHS